MQISTDVSPGAWDDFVSSHSEASGYHRWGWKGVFERGLGHRTHYLAAMEAGRICGILPTVEVRSWLFGRTLSSLPYVNYGGVLADTEAARAGLLASAVEFARRRGLTDVLLRHTQRQFPALPVRTHKVAMLLPLDRTIDGMWTRLDRKVRNQIRKAQKSGVTVQTGSVELLDDFYGVFARNMRDLGTPVYGRKLFEAILTAFPGHAKLHVARLESTAVAGALSYRSGTVLEVPSASSLREHRTVCPNYLVYWTVLQEAIDQGCSTFDFGRSTPADGSYHFKEQWGGVPHQLWWECAGVLRPARIEPPLGGGSLNIGIAVWKRLPVTVATTLGPRIVRAVP
jgi:serine/alanine adding enzyme